MMSDSPPICDYEGSSYRSDFWQGQGREYEDAAERIALRALLPASGRRLLDIGAGFGRLASLYDGFDQVVLLDYSHSQLAEARRELGDERFIYVAADVYRLPLVQDAVDVAVMVRVLHHIADVPAVLEQIARVLRPDGDFILEHANKRHLKNILRHLIDRGSNPFDQEPFEFAKLHYDFHPKWVRNELQATGFRIHNSRAVSMLRMQILKRWFPLGVLLGLERLLQRPLASLAISPSVFLATTNPKAAESDAKARALPPDSALFRCIACGHAPLQSVADGVICPRCNRHWPLIEGVYVFK